MTALSTRLRALLGEKIPVGGSDTDTFFTDTEIDTLLTNAGNDVRRAAAEGWQNKAAEYASLVDVTEGNASRLNSTLHSHALDMVKMFTSAGSQLTSGRTRVGRIVRNY